MKSEFKGIPVYLSLDDKITAKFTTFFLSLVLYRFLEKRYTCSQIIETIRNMNLNKVSKIGYIPAYTRTDLTDSLHHKLKFRTDNEITTTIIMKKILK